MSIIASILLYGIALLTAFLGVVVFLRNPTKRTQRLFVTLSVSTSLWIVSNAVFGQSSNDNILYPVALLSYVFAAAAAVSFLFFVVNISGAVRRSLILRIVSSLFVVAVGLPGVIATRVEHKIIVTTPFILVYALVMAAYFIVGIWLLGQGIRHQRGQRRQQLSTVLLGLLGSIIGGVIFNLFLPIYGDYRFIQIGPAFSMLFVGASAYAIVRHRLFDLRAAIIRALVYSLAVLAAATLYVILAFVVTSLLGGLNVSWYTQFVYVVLAILLALTFQPIKHIFDRATKAIFYKNAYDAQEVLDKLGTLLVREVDVNKLVKRSIQVLADAIKPLGITVVLLKDHSVERQIVIGKSLQKTDALIKTMRQHHLGLLVGDELVAQSGELYQLLTDASVAVATPLVTSNATVGYLLVGYKASGDAFSIQDVNLLRIFADELAVAVQNAQRFEEISRFNITLKDEVDEATLQLRASNRKLHKLDAAKDEFISMTSHQLRTPLTSVKGYLSMVLEGDAGKISDDQRKLLEEAYSSAQRMVYLIGDFLNVSRLQTDRFVLELSPVNLARLVAEEVEQLKATAARRGVRLEYHEPANFPPLMLDEGKMRQVMMNFIDNAIFYSPQNSAVTIELTTGLRDVVLSVHDSGIGVPQAERHHIFTKFYRATNARRVRPDGTGIGLYMAKKVVAAHGGSIIFETKENKGSTFGFSLPLKNQPQ